MISEKTERDVGTLFDRAIRAGVVLPIDNNYRFLMEKGLYDAEGHFEFNLSLKFQHDRIQQAAHSSIDKEKRNTIHLSIARILSREKNSIDNLITITRHYNEALDLVDDPDEQLKVISLNLEAAIKSKNVNAYKTAESFLGYARRFLKETFWDTHYDITYSVYYESAEVSFMCGDFNKGEIFSDILLNKADKLVEKVNILNFKAIHYANAERLLESVRMLLKALSLVGVRMNLNPGYHTIFGAIVLARLSLGFRSPLDLLELPPMKDEKILLTVKLIMQLIQSAYMTGYDNLYILGILTGTKLIHRHGHCPEASWLLSTYALVLSHILLNLKSSRLYQVVSKHFLENSANLYYRGRNLFAYSFFANFWHNDQKESEKYFKLCMEINYQVGNQFELSATACQYVVCTQSLNINEMVKKQQQHTAIIRNTNEKIFIYGGNFIEGLFRNPAGLTPTRYSVSHGDFNEYRASKSCMEMGFYTTVVSYYSGKIKVLYYRGKYKQAILYSKRAAKNIKSVIGVYWEIPYRFFKLLSYMAVFHELNIVQRAIAWLHISMEYFIISRWGDHNPPVFMHFKLIAKGELLRIKGAPFDKVLKAFEEAIESAKGKSDECEGLANQLAMQYCIKKDFKDLARHYFNQALYVFKTWGADSFCQELTDKYGDVLNTQKENRKDETKKKNRNRTRTQAQTGTRNDRITMIGSAQAPAEIKAVMDRPEFTVKHMVNLLSELSKEIKMETLLKKAVMMMVENFGAEKGIVLL
ncbi:MAG: hypothetical protein HQK54_16790, partial [Oligoflexales bacterium]|nr:hypothetical protein [Oligoflexales bacterium]